MSTNYFSLNSYLETANQEQDTEKKDYNANKNLVSFYSLCKKISQYFLEGWESEQGKDGSTAEQLLEYQKKAIIGYPSEINYFI